MLVLLRSYHLVYCAALRKGETLQNSYRPLDADIGTIILVIGLVEMLKFLYKNGDLDLGGPNKKSLFFLRPRRASVRDGVRRGCYCVRAVCYCVQGIEITTT